MIGNVMFASGRLMETFVVKTYLILILENPRNESNNSFFATLFKMIFDFPSVFLLLFYIWLIFPCGEDQLSVKILNSNDSELLS